MGQPRQLKAWIKASLSFFVVSCLKGQRRYILLLDRKLSKTMASKDKENNARGKNPSKKETTHHVPVRNITSITERKLEL
jgi:hypothetical protein